jgi:hypothetical protein
MRTTILAYVIAFLGLIMIGGGIWGLFMLAALPWAELRRPCAYCS